MEQKVKIGLHIRLGCGIGMVEIAESIKIISSISSPSYLSLYARISISIGFIGVTNLGIIGVVPLHFILLSGFSSRHILLWKVHPTIESILMIDNNVFDKSRSFRMEKIDHVSQLRFRSPATVMI